MKIEDARIVIATPVAGGEPWSAHVVAGYSESIRLLQQRVPVKTISAVTTYHTDNIRARNRIAAKALRENPKMTHLLWWDSDNWVESRSIRGHIDESGGAEYIAGMLARDEDMIAAVYTQKKIPSVAIPQGLDARQPVNNLLEVRCVGFGFTMTSRACLEHMSEASRNGGFDGLNAQGYSRPYRDAPLLDVIPNIFGMLYDDADGEILLSEDFSFCKRWRHLGGRVMLFLEGIVMHSGAHGFSVRETAGKVIV